MRVLLSIYCSIIVSAHLLAQNTANTDSLSLYFFLLDDCPICISYTSEINQLYKDYGDEIGFIGYFPNFSSKKDKIDTYRATYDIQFPLQTDYFKRQAKKWKATVTPEVILYDHATETVLYQGRIDNTFIRLGRRRNVVTETDLRDAISATLHDEPIKNKYVEPVGCYINYSDNIDE